MAKVYTLPLLRHHVQAAYFLFLGQLAYSLVTGFANLLECLRELGKPLYLSIPIYKAHSPHGSGTAGWWKCAAQRVWLAGVASHPFWCCQSIHSFSNLKLSKSCSSGLSFFSYFLDTPASISKYWDYRYE